MILKKVAPLIAGALLLASVSTSAQAAVPGSAGALSLAAAMQSSGAETGEAGIGATLMPVFILVAFALVAVAFQSDGDDSPSSP